MVLDQSASRTVASVIALRQPRRAHFFPMLGEVEKKRPMILRACNRDAAMYSGIDEGAC
jgi:hypothetical protein